MSAYGNDDRVEHHEGSYLVTGPDRQWTVIETAQQWDAWPYPECVEPAFDDQGYFALCLAGNGALRADDKIRELIGDPQ